MGATSDRSVWIKSILGAVIITVLALPLSLAVWLATADWVDPAKSLPRPGDNPVLLNLEPPPQVDGRLRNYYWLDDLRVGPVRFIIDRPRGSDTLEPLPVIILLGGAPLGQEALAYMPPVGRNAIVSLDWPMPVPDDLERDLNLLFQEPALRPSTFGDSDEAEAMRQLWRQQVDALLNIAGLRSDILRAPGQVAAVHQWLRQQNWVDPTRISLIGVSLGAVIAPAAQHMIEAITPQTDGNPPISASLLAFGGTNIERMITENPSLKATDWVTGWPTALPLLGWAGGKALHPLEPSHYLPQLSGQFMVVNASRDGVIPQASVNEFTALVPEPKDTATIAGGHIGPDPETPRILRTLTGIATGWLMGLEAVNAPG
ncbi:MAG: hypothetical protein AAF213_13915 [Pseudomonadota bacterium]